MACRPIIAPRAPVEATTAAATAAEVRLPFASTGIAGGGPRR